LELVVEDSGPGIEPGEMEKIFEPLYSTKSFGVGLGLPNVQQIMEQHGGGIKLDSEPGSGARMVLWFPQLEVKEEGAT
jgi:signal transduction histidine kinase